MNPEFLQILRCPETHQPLQPADPAFLDRINQSIRSGRLTARSGQPVTQPLDGALIRLDHQVFYPIRDTIPVLLVDEAIAVPIT
jgi:uncharacterized protein YbaR (Trm112 family)